MRAITSIAAIIAVAEAVKIPNAFGSSSISYSDNSSWEVA